MNPRLVIRICLISFFGLAILYVVGKWHAEAWQNNPMYPFLAIISIAIAGGFLFVTVVLPQIGDALGTVMYSSGEEIKADEGMKAAAKMASGDYEGAIEEYEKALAEKPDDTFTISEVAKIKGDKLEQPDEALTYLQEHLEAREWPQDDAAFLMFRIADIYTHAESWDSAKSVLEQIIGDFPGTRHSSTAKHRISELDQAQFKQLQAQRAKDANPPA